MPSPLRGALIGCGFFGRIQLEAWRRMHDVDIAAACDPEPGRAAQCAPRAYTSVEAMLDAERLDFLDIATRPDTHLDLVRRAVERRIPAICQKPMASSLGEAIEMEALVRAASARVMIHENWRWQPWYRLAKSMLQSGEIGQPLAYTFRIRQRDGLGPTPYPNQPYFREMPRLLIFETLIHPIDTARFLFGPIAAVFAQIRRANPVIRGEDRAVVILTHAARLDGIVDGHRFADPDPPGPAMGDAIFEGDAGVIRIAANGDVFHNGALRKSHDTSSGYKGDSVLATERHFIDRLRDGAEFETSVSDYFHSFAAIEAAYESAAAGRVIAPRAVP